MRALLITIAVLALAFDLAAMSMLLDPPIIFAIEVTFVMGWGAIYWFARHIASFRWVALATGAFTLFGPLRWVLFNWCLLIGQCVA